MLALSGQCSAHPFLCDLHNVDDLDIVESQCHDLLGVEYARRPEYRLDYVSMILMDFAHMEELDLDTVFVLIRPLNMTLALQLVADRAFGWALLITTRWSMPLVLKTP